MYLDLVALKLFVDVVDCGSYRKAAARNRLSVNDLVSRVRQLEHALCVPLLQRHSGSICTTSVGSRLHALASERLAHFAQEVQRLCHRPGLRCRKVNLCLCLDFSEPAQLANTSMPEAVGKVG